jgi:hypothetical protein
VTAAGAKTNSSSIPGVEVALEFVGADSLIRRLINDNQNASKYGRYESTTVSRYELQLWNSRPLNLFPYSYIY